MRWDQVEPVTEVEGFCLLPVFVVGFDEMALAFFITVVGEFWQTC